MRQSYTGTPASTGTGPARCALALSFQRESRAADPSHVRSISLPAAQCPPPTPPHTPPPLRTHPHLHHDAAHPAHAPAGSSRKHRPVAVLRRHHVQPEAGAGNEAGRVGHVFLLPLLLLHQAKLAP